MVFFVGGAALREAQVGLFSWCIGGLRWRLAGCSHVRYQRQPCADQYQVLDDILSNQRKPEWTGAEALARTEDQRRKRTEHVDEKDDECGAKEEAEQKTEANSTLNAAKNADQRFCGEEMCCECHKRSAGKVFGWAHAGNKLERSEPEEDDPKADAWKDGPGTNKERRKPPSAEVLRWKINVAAESFLLHGIEHGDNLSIKKKCEG